MQRLAALVSIALLVMLVACGGSSVGNNVVPPVTQVKLNVTTASTLVGQAQQFTANVPVTWTVKEANGGTITGAGLYTAPRNVGTFHVIATANSDATQSATATVSISAKFGFLQEVEGGSTPYSTTPILATMAPDGKITTQNVIDSTTNKPVDTQMEDVALSPDGTKAVFTQLTYDVNLEEDYQAIWIANVDGSSVRQLTFPTTPTDWASDRYPSFTPDGKLVIFSRQDSNGSASANTSYSIRMISLDGITKSVVFAGDASQPLGSFASPYIYHAAVSPDGKTVATELAYYDATSDVWIDGIATTDLTGQNRTQLTGDPRTVSFFAYDEMPAYTADGNAIVFARLVDSETSMSERIISMSPTGTNQTLLHGVDGLISCQPRAVANQIAFSSNVDNPATDWFEMYIFNNDGSNLNRLTSNTLYDGFSIWWMNGNYPATANARVMEQAKRISPLQHRLDHLKQIREHRKRR